MTNAKTASHEVAGYLHPDYAASLAEFGSPRLLPRSRGWILERTIPGTERHDAMGCYPLFACLDWSQLAADLEELTGVVSLALVTDPFADCEPSTLAACFDHMAPFKQHYVSDLTQPPETFVSKHHRYYARRALRSVSVGITTRPSELLDDWVRLYSALVQRHGLRGIKAFSRNAFARQMAVPGAVLLHAELRGRIVAAHLWYVSGDVAYSHLAAADDAGYQVMAPYALYWTALRYLAGTVRWLALGAGAGREHADANGLGDFKRGWSTSTRTAYFAGRVFDRAAYSRIAPAPPVGGAYFPAYRAGEFCAAESTRGEPWPR